MIFHATNVLLYVFIIFYRNSAFLYDGPKRKLFLIMAFLCFCTKYVLLLLLLLLLLLPPNRVIISVQLRNGDSGLEFECAGKLEAENKAKYLCAVHLNELSPTFTMVRTSSPCRTINSCSSSGVSVRVVTTVVVL